MRINRYLLALVAVLLLCNPARADIYLPGPAINTYGPVLSSQTVSESHYCQDGDFRTGLNVSVQDLDEWYSDEGSYIGEVSDMDAPSVWTLSGVGELRGIDYHAPTHGGGSATITRTVDDIPLYADDPPVARSTTMIVGPSRIEVRALGYEGWMPQAWQPGMGSGTEELGNSILRAYPKRPACLRVIRAQAN
jgi:hypothetical protein